MQILVYTQEIGGEKQLMYVLYVHDIRLIDSSYLTAFNNELFEIGNPGI